MFQLLITSEVALEGPLQPAQAAWVADQLGATSDPEPSAQHGWQTALLTAAQNLGQTLLHLQETGEDKKVIVNNTSFFKHEHPLQITYTGFS